jgi:dTDP-4-amino-4,6-dideoxygalactose transaminase
LVDVEADTFGLDPAALEPALGPSTKAIIVVHLYGHPADVHRISKIASERGIVLIEDCAQAQDASVGDRMVGSIGDLGCFSFYPTKTLGAVGDGGLVASREPRYVERLQRLRTYGWTSPQFSELGHGRCSRLDELQAAVLNVKLERLAEFVERRRAIAHFYDSAFSDLPLLRPIERAGFRHVYHLYVVRCEKRDELRSHLKSVGIMTGQHYPYPVHRQPGLMWCGRAGGSLAVTEHLANEILSLPLYPTMPPSQQARVVDAVRSFFKKS